MLVHKPEMTLFILRAIFSGDPNVTLIAERDYHFGLIPENKWRYKWIKWIEKIELTDNPNYRGYWEQRGYSNSGDLNGSYLYLSCG